MRSSSRAAISRARAFTAGAAAVLATSVTLARSARAQDAAAAEALFKAGKALAAEQRYAEACPKLEASYALDATLGALLNLADCHEHLGLLAKAWSEWALGSSRARAKGDPARADLAQRHVEALEPRLPHLTIAVKGTAAELKVTRDETPVPEGMYGQDTPVDPGKHTVVVRRGDQVLRRVDVALEERGRQVVALDFPEIAKISPPPEKPRDAEPPPPTTAMLVRSGFQSGTIALGGIGFLTAVALEISAFAIRKSELGSNCAQTPSVTYCNSQGLSDIQLARTLATVGEGVGIGGLVLLATGITLAATAPKTPKTAPRDAQWLVPWVGQRARSAGVAVGGFF